MFPSSCPLSYRWTNLCCVWYFLPLVLTLSQVSILPFRCWDMAEVAVEVICKAIWENAKFSRARHTDWKSGGHHIHFLELNWAFEPDIYLEVPGCSKSPNHSTIVESESYQVVLLDYPNRIFIRSVMSKLKPKNWRRSQERGRIARLGRVGSSSAQTCTADVPAPS